jgi:hypothetical protein
MSVTETQLQCILILQEFPNRSQKVGAFSHAINLPDRSARPIGSAHPWRNNWLLNLPDWSARSRAAHERQAAQNSCTACTAAAP